MNTQKRRAVVGPYTLVNFEVGADPDNMQVVHDLWAIPGGEVLTAKGLAMLAARNGWKLTYVNAETLH